MLGSTKSCSFPFTLSHHKSHDTRGESSKTFSDSPGDRRLLLLHHFINQSPIKIIGSILERNSPETENKFQLALFSFAVELNRLSRAAIKVIAAFFEQLPNKFPFIASAIVFRSIQTNLLHPISIFRFTFLRFPAASRAIEAEMARYQRRFAKHEVESGNLFMEISSLSDVE